MVEDIFLKEPHFLVKVLIIFFFYTETHPSNAYTLVWDLGQSELNSETESVRLTSILLSSLQSRDISLKREKVLGENSLMSCLGCYGRNNYLVFLVRIRPLILGRQGIVSLWSNIKSSYLLVPRGS